MVAQIRQRLRYEKPFPPPPARDEKNQAVDAEENAPGENRFALPGDQVEFELERMNMEDKAVNRAYAGIGFVKGKKKIRAEFEGDVIPFSDIEDVDEQKRFFKLLTRDLRL